MPFPEIDPIIFQIGPLAVRWYGVMYLFGFAIAWFLLRGRAGKPGFEDWTKNHVEDLIFFGALGLIIGARVGYVFFYGFDRLLDDPLYLFKITEGGMSFHGGLIGVFLAMVYFAKTRKRGVFEVTDFLAPGAPLGIFCGRMGNFINGELWGKPTEVPWGFVYEGVNRHPSQLYEAFLEGIVLFAILWTFSAKPRPRMAVSGMFLLIYGIFRFAVEFVRVPDEHLAYLALGWVTMGQILSSPMILLGAILLFIAYRRKRSAALAGKVSTS